jgi:hypothetical protein
LQALRGVYYIHVVLGFLRTIWGTLRAGLPDFFPLVVGVAGVLLAMMPGLAAGMERRSRLLKVIGAILAVLGLWAFLEQLSAKHESQRQITQLLNAAATQATSEDVRGLRQDIRDGLASVERAIGSLQQSATLQITPTFRIPTPTATPITRHIRYVERETASDVSEYPYSLQVIVQTDIVTQPTALLIQFDGLIGDGKFFVAGQSVMMAVQYSITADHKGFVLKFAFPSWTPESSVVTTVYSKNPVHVVSVTPLQQ